MSNESNKSINISPQPKILYLSKRELIEKLLRILFTEPIIVTREDPRKYIYVRKDPFLISINVIEERDELKFISDLFTIERGVAVDRDKQVIYEIISVPRRGFWEIYTWSPVYDSLIEYSKNNNEEIYICSRCGATYREFNRLYKHFISKHKMSISTISGREVIKIILDLLNIERVFRDREEDIEGVKVLSPKKLFL
ncbi:MAG: hypothetical protein ACP5GI_06630 [Sulfolobales archaeon]